MEKKSLLQYLREEAGTNQHLAERVVKTLAANSIYTIDLLMAKSSEELYAIKGIGNAAMNLISRVTTKEKAYREKMEEAYRKQCHKCMPTTLRDWFKEAGCSSMEAANIEKIMKKNGVKTIDMFMHLTFGDFEQMNGIAQKRLETISKTKKLIEKTKNKNYEKCIR